MDTASKQALIKIAPWRQNQRELKLNQELNRRSHVITDGDAGAPRRAQLRAVNFKDGDWGKPVVGVLNLLSIYQAFSGDTDDAMNARFAGMRYGDLKKEVAEMTIAQLEPFQQRYREIVNEPGYLRGVLREGAERVRPIAQDTVRLAKGRMGLYVG